MTSDTQAYVNWFRHSTPYINAHRGKTFVIAFPGEAVAHTNFLHFIQDIVLLHSLGIRIVLVHGARPQIDQRLEESGLPIRIEYHRRVTDLAAMPAALEAIGRTSIQIQCHLAQGMAAAHIHPGKQLVATGNYVAAKPYGVRNGVDYQLSGEVRKINHTAIHQQLDDGDLVLLSPIGFSPTGEVFNLLWEEVAAATAIALKADKILYLSEQEGILSTDGELIRELTVPQASELINDFEQPHYSLISARDTVTAGINRAHIISYEEDGALLQELFTVDGKGTMLARENYEKVRAATIDDVASVLELIEPIEQQGILVRRSRELLETEIEHFTLIERDGKVIACAALYPFPDEQAGELACVVVHPEYRHGDRGDTLLKTIEQRALTRGLNSLFVLTTRTAHWFVERGFAAATVAELPQHRQSLYNFQRNSKVFLKHLAAKKTPVR
ncbi:amino-acid N-acetyltransferase [Ketobacter sp. MCCC 1A13808]|uniref:amino-acid N-acetyltransferase n=1 Tax=Ketobacter sp. MCCC 1A13808 TaxID=2602738 RepID=UPI000F2677DF|nr:amino-acid N-acetyltransferase [Ketobacter sp. MCCC 1A13808]MVF11761.1 amino-acid N-acetyltransferase [Ketobacter sp. MCCC 1A13808]RLP55368.1 MAG: amino-acid N-acetyltransferase [Ketobacter sp.]